LIVIVLLTLAVLTFSRFMTAQRRATNTTLRQTQARLLAESGIEYVRAMLLYDRETILNLGGLYDNENEFCGHIVTDGTVGLSGFAAGTQVSESNIDRRDVGRFSVIAPAHSENGLLLGEYIRYGLVDESTKLNLHWVLQMDRQQFGTGRALLMRLPGVDEEIADSILDWIDESSDEPREYGAKDEYYTSLEPPYYTRNGMPDSLDELLLVRGVTPKLLYGIDWNRNGIIDLGEPDEYSLDEYDVIDGSLNLGLIEYLTLDSRESILTPDGLDKINVNMEDMTELRSLLTERFEEYDPQWANYIISFRLQANQPVQPPGGVGTMNVVPGLPGGSPAGAAGNTDGKIKSLLDFVGGQGSPFADDPDEMNEYLPVLYDNLMTSDMPIVGRINLNQASRTVLELFASPDDEQSEEEETQPASLLAGTTSTQTDMWNIIDQIVEMRVSDPYLVDLPEMKYPFWIYTHGIIPDLAMMKRLEPYVCAQGAVFKATVVGRFDERSPVSRLEVWLDAAEGGRLPKVIRFRDISDLGPGYSAELLGADMLVR
jgi:hypothetical protein